MDSIGRPCFRESRGFAMAGILETPPLPPNNNPEPVVVVPVVRVVVVAIGRAQVVAIIVP
jgi:hypothetical protein